MDGNFGMPGMGGMGMNPGMNGMNMTNISFNMMNPFTSMNTMMPGMNIGGNWMSIYNNNNFPQMNNNNVNINNSGFGGQPGDNKINVVFKTTMGIITNVLIDRGKTMSYLFQVYLKKVNKFELFNKPNTIFFLFNANRFDFLDSNLVEKVFAFTPNPTIVVNDIRGLIGA